MNITLCDWVFNSFLGSAPSQVSGGDEIVFDKSCPGALGLLEKTSSPLKLDPSLPQT